MPSGEGDGAAVPGTDPGGDDRPGPGRFTIEVDGEHFAVRRAADGGWAYDWLSGPNDGYGFGLSGPADGSLDDHAANVRSFLGMIDPATGYLAEPTDVQRPRWLAVLPAAAGLGVVAALVAVATLAGDWVPVVGAPVFGILFGLAAGIALRQLDESHAQAVEAAGRLSARRPLQIAIVLLGSGLSLRQVAHVGGHSLPVMAGTLFVALVGSRVAGRALRVAGDTKTLIGVGTAICGASAIAAATAVIEATEADVAYAIGTIFTFNIAAVLIFPALGHAFGLSQRGFGLWAGTAINDTSSVVAASTIYGSVAAGYGIVVKLTRSLMIIPICVALALKHRGRSAANLPWTRMLPLFLVGFIIACGLNTAGAVPARWHSALSTTAGVLITVALTGIGLTTRPSSLRAAGARPLILGGALWVAVAVTSLLLQSVTGAQ